MSILAHPLVLNIRGPDLIIVALVFLLFFGGKKLPDLARGLGEGIKNFKNSVKNDQEPGQEDKKTQAGD
ncbi:MAG: twin-arginine translocase TatA/TatE family subunit [Acidobacteriaceae bacterium]|nr:twin-arginine translocase TatA/TatE family subunit [Acidobacteriaceae bacterium]